jgi:TfoX N-terminal domain
VLRFTVGVRRLNTPRRSLTKARSAIPKWPKLLRISEELRQWTGMLEHEVSSWPRVTSRPMFGLVSFYHNGIIFAALPRTRALSTPDSFIFKFDPMPPDLLRRAIKDPRISSERQTPGVKWYSFELDSVADIRDALWWLNRAYEAAK